MTPAFRTRQPTGPVLPMDRQDARYPHRIAMPARAYREWRIKETAR